MLLSGACPQSVPCHYTDSWGGCCCPSTSKKEHRKKGTAAMHIGSGSHKTLVSFRWQMP